MSYTEINQKWITQKIGTDIVPLLVNLCSEECEEKIPTAPDNYIKYPHKGGVNLIQSLSEEEEVQIRHDIIDYNSVDENIELGEKNDQGNYNLQKAEKGLEKIKLKWKIWK